jgi:hypothetical protein
LTFCLTPSTISPRSWRASSSSRSTSAALSRVISCLRPFSDDLSQTNSSYHCQHRRARARRGSAAYDKTRQSSQAQGHKRSFPDAISEGSPKSIGFLARHLFGSYVDYCCRFTHLVFSLGRQARIRVTNQ